MAIARMGAQILQNDSPASLHLALGLLGLMILVLICFALWALWYRLRRGKK